uniref:TTF-type domain-containing protein n=1 Tax=Acanthochromis polyacanthus TaxID=80966 RepID=A0A3Q1FCV8_9TELE
WDELLASLIGLSGASQTHSGSAGSLSWRSDRKDTADQGPLQLSPSTTFPKSPDGRSFHHHYTFTHLINGEKIQRSWLVYSPKNNAVYCFCCKVFSSKTTKLISDGLKDWVNVGVVLKHHENSREHCENMIKWSDLKARLAQGKTRNAAECAIIEMEKNRMRDVLTRLASIVQSLAERNLAFRGSVDTLHQVNNGNFLKEVELLAKYDPVLKEHLRRIHSGTQHSAYLGKTIQNELISCLSDKIMNTIVAEIKSSKYYALILDCTPDLSHTEQMSIVVRIVTTAVKPEIKEHFLGFVIAPDSMGQCLSKLILDRLQELNLSFQDCRGQSYDNGANMRGKNKGVQARLLAKNPRALYVPCGAHTLNLMIADAAKASKDAAYFFANVEKVYKLFSGSHQRWSILKENVSVTLKTWSETRWESRIKSIEPLRCQAGKVRDALVNIWKKANNNIVEIEAHSLAEEIGSFRFQICCVVWYDILVMTNTVSKLLQSVNMQLDVALNLIQTTKDNLISYRTHGFLDAQATAKEICEQMNTETGSDEPIQDAMKRLEVSFFNAVVDCAIHSLEDRFQSLKDVSNNFGILLDFTKLDAQTRREKCKLLEEKLACGGDMDVDGCLLAMEMEYFPKPQKPHKCAFELLTYLSENDLCELYPNLWVALRIACTMPVTVASAERSFSKLKLIKSYLRSSMSQERLSGLAVISINNKIANEISYDDVTDDFAHRKARKQRF